MKLKLCSGLLVCGMLLIGAAFNVTAEEGVKVGKGGGFVPLAKDKPYIYVIHEGSSVKVQRIQDPDYELRGYFAKTVRSCPPFCIQPIVPDPRVKPVGEVELFDFMEKDLRDGSGVLIDARTPSWFNKATIPGSVNLPFTLLSKEPGSAEMDEVLEKFGAKERGDVGFFTRLMEKIGLADTKYKTEEWDFTDAKRLVLWCNGPACGQSPRAIRGLIAADYPTDKILYYRGGMQMWQLWGLTTVSPKQ